MSNFKEKRKLLRLLEEFSKDKSIVYEDQFVDFIGQIGLDKYNKNKGNKNIHLDLKLLERCIHDGYIERPKDFRNTQLLLTSNGIKFIKQGYWFELKKKWITKEVIKAIIWAFVALIFTYIGYIMGRLS